MTCTRINKKNLQYTTDYIDGFVYITPGTGAAALSYFPMPEGRVLYNGSTFTQQFILTDPQGNARISFQNNGSGNVSVQQETSYYGFGYQMAGSLVALPPVPNKQLYNGGSEWQNDYSNLPDYDQTFFRNYDAALGRWVGVDPSAEGAESMTGYQYAGDNPIMMNDPDGDLARPFTPCGCRPPIVLHNYVWDQLQADMQNFDDQVDDGTDGATGGGGWSLNLYLDRIGQGPDVVAHMTPGDIGFTDFLNKLTSANSISVQDNGVTFWSTAGKSISNPNYKPGDQSGDPFYGPTIPSLAPHGEFLSFGQIRGAFLDNQLSRTQVPDVIGVNASINVVPLIGGGLTYSFFLITRGPSHGLYITKTTYLRAGAEVGVSVNGFEGYFLGNILTTPDAAKGLLGISLDFEGAAFGADIDGWVSFGGALPKWAGVGLGIGPKAGGSGGVGNTEAIYGY